jgi:hypothetical protein
MVLPPNSMVDPLVLRRLVHCDDFDQRSRRVAALNVKRPARKCKSEDQAAWAIFVVRIVLNDFARLNGFPDFVHAYAAQDGLISGVQREFKSVAGEFGSDFGNSHCHADIISL